MLQRIVEYALRQGSPEWDLVASSAVLCMGNQCHGRHCEPMMTDPWRYWWVCQAHQRVLNLMANANPSAGEALACLGEINHGGGGGDGSGPGISTAARAALKKLRQRLIAAFRRAGPG